MIKVTRMSDIPVKSPEGVSNRPELPSHPTLVDFLKHIVPCEPDMIPAKEAIRKLKNFSFSLSAINRAKRKVDVRSIKKGNQWYWQFPKESNQYQEYLFRRASFKHTLLENHLRTLVPREPNMIPVSEVKRRLNDSGMSFSLGTIQRVKKKLRIRSIKSDDQRCWQFPYHPSDWLFKKELIEECLKKIVPCEPDMVLVSEAKTHLSDLVENFEISLGAGLVGKIRRKLGIRTFKLNHKWYWQWPEELYPADANLYSNFCDNSSDYVVGVDFSNVLGEESSEEPSEVEYA